MHDLRLIRENPPAFDGGLAKRGLAPQSGRALELDARRRAVVTAKQAALSRRNEASKQIGQAKAKGQDAALLMAEVAELKDRIAAGEEEERAVAAEIEDLLAGLPNLPADDVPVGDEGANMEVRRVGAPPHFAFAPKQHFELGEALGLMDFEAAQRISGARFVVLKGALARLERALAAFMLDLHTAEFGYQETNGPLMVREHAAFGTGNLPKFKDDLFAARKLLDERASALMKPAMVNYLAGLSGFSVSGDGNALAGLAEGIAATATDVFKRDDLYETFYLIPTAEMTLTNLVREQIVAEETLPLRFAAHTPCFRSEAGAAGRDTRGMIRQHQFSKVELVSIVKPEESEAEHERMTACAEEVLKRLGLAYRVVLLASRDMGFSARKTYDIEVWLPGQDAWREISSCSNCGDFQARRMNARSRAKGEKGGRFVHTLNGSGLAVGRTLIAVLENYQRADGSIGIPAALRPYMGGLEAIAAHG